MNTIIASDLEGPIISIDHAFLAMSKFVTEGEKIFKIISKYDDFLFWERKKENYEIGNTLSFIIPFLIANNVSEKQLKSISTEAGYLYGAKESIKKLKKQTPFYIISTSYSQLVDFIAKELDIPKKNTFSTKLELEKIKKVINKKDISLINCWGKKISKMDKLTNENIEELDYFFESIIPSTSFNIIKNIKPVGGNRKYEAIKEIIKKEKSEKLIVCGDSITDSVMLKKARGMENSLSIAVNPNKFAIESADVVVAMTTFSPLEQLIYLFDKNGKEITKKLTGNNPLIWWIDENTDLEKIVNETKLFRLYSRNLAGYLG